MGLGWVWIELGWICDGFRMGLGWILCGFVMDLNLFGMVGDGFEMVWVGFGMDLNWV